MEGEIGTMEGERETMEGERETMEGEIGTMEGKRAAVDRDKERAAMEGMTQSFQQEKVKTQKRLKNLLDRHKNDQEVSNKKRDNAKHVTHNKKIAACKAHKERKQRQVEEILVNQTGQDTPTQDQADTGIPISFTQQDSEATKVIEAVRDNTDTEQDENAKWAPNVGREFTTNKKGRKILEEIYTNGRTQIIEKDTE